VVVVVIAPGMQWPWLPAPSCTITDGPFGGCAANTPSSKRYSEMLNCAAWSAIAGCGGDGTGEAPSAAEKLDAGLDDVVELTPPWPWEKYDDIEGEKKQETSPTADW
jgi:hypothetical protein